MMPADVSDISDVCSFLLSSKGQSVEKEGQHTQRGSEGNNIAQMSETSEMSRPCGPRSKGGKST